MIQIQMKTKTFISVIVSVALLIIYVYFFGQNSIRKYVDNAVFVTTLEEKPKYITPPGITLEKTYYTQNIICFFQ